MAQMPGRWIVTCQSRKFEYGIRLTPFPAQIVSRGGIHGFQNLAIRITNVANINLDPYGP